MLKDKGYLLKENIFSINHILCIKATQAEKRVKGIFLTKIACFDSLVVENNACAIRRTFHV